MPEAGRERADMIHAVTEAAVRAHMTETPVEDVITRLDVDWDGDPIVRVWVVATDGRVDVDEATRLVGYILPELRRLNVERFPLVATSHQKKRRS